MIDYNRDSSDIITTRHGKKYSTGCLKILIGNGITKKITDLVEDLLPIGRIAIFSESKCKYADEISSILRKICYKIEHYRIDEKDENDILILDKLDIPEDVRVIIGVGNIQISRLAKISSFRKKIPNIHILTSPNDTRYLLNSFIDTTDIITYHNTTTPTYLIADCALEYSREQAVQGMGNLYATAIGIFDYIYSHIANNLPYDKDITTAILNDITDFFSTKYEHDYASSRLKLYLAICDISAKLTCIKDLWRIDSSFIASCLLEKYGVPKHLTPLISAHTIKSIYTLYLDTLPPNFASPSDKSIYIDRLADLFEIDKTELLHSVEVTASYELMKQRFITNSNIGEISSKLMEVFPNAKERVSDIKSILPDMGYSICDIISYKELLNIITLSTTLNKNTLLEFIDFSGFLCHYVYAN